MYFDRNKAEKLRIIPTISMVDSRLESVESEPVRLYERLHVRAGPLLTTGSVYIYTHSL